MTESTGDYQTEKLACKEKGRKPILPSDNPDSVNRSSTGKISASALNSDHSSRDTEDIKEISGGSRSHIVDLVGQQFKGITNR